MVPQGPFRCKREDADRSIYSHYVNLIITTCDGFGAVPEEALAAEGASEALVLLLGAGQRQEHAQDGHVLIVFLGLLDAICTNGLGLEP